jgi:hypothetical protein
LSPAERSTDHIFSAGDFGRMSYWHKADIVPARGTAELADIIRIRHVSGDVSTISLKAYSQGREASKAPRLIIRGSMKSGTQGTALACFNQLWSMFPQSRFSRGTLLPCEP